MEKLYAFLIGAGIGYLLGFLFFFGFLFVYWDFSPLFESMIWRTPVVPALCGGVIGILLVDYYN